MFDWNSIESVTRLENLLTSASHFALFMLLVFEVGAHLAGNKKSMLEEVASKEKEKQIQSLQAQQVAEQSLLRNVSVVINVRFSGDWNESDPPFSEKYFIMPPGDTYFLQFALPFAGGMRWTNFYGVRMYNFVSQGEKQRVFVADLALKSDDALLGQSIEVLKGINGAVIYIPFVAPNKLNKPGIHVTYVAIAFTVNNRKKFFREYHINAETFPTQIPDNRFTPISVPLDGKEMFSD